MGQVNTEAAEEPLQTEADEENEAQQTKTTVPGASPDGTDESAQEGRPTVHLKKNYGNEANQDLEKAREESTSMAEKMAANEGGGNEQASVDKLEQKEIDHEQKEEEPKQTAEEEAEKATEQVERMVQDEGKIDADDEANAHGVGSQNEPSSHK